MIDKPNSPLRQRMIEDLTSRFELRKVKSTTALPLHPINPAEFERVDNTALSARRVVTLRPV